MQRRHPQVFAWLPVARCIGTAGTAWFFARAQPGSYSASCRRATSGTRCFHLPRQETGNRAGVNLKSPKCFEGLTYVNGFVGFFIVFLYGGQFCVSERRHNGTHSCHVFNGGVLNCGIPKSPWLSQYHIPSGNLTVCELEHDHRKFVALPIIDGNFP